MKNNGTPYTDEQWEKWYASKSSSEIWEEYQEKLAEEEK